MSQTETIPAAEAAKANGKPPALAEVVFPLDTFRDAATHLRRPFSPAAVKFKVQATYPKDNPTGGLIVAYIDARLAVERLNLIVPHLWHDEYEPTNKGLMWCHLTVDGIRRSDIGEGTGKGLVSDALKRAAVKFGVGVSLYAIPKMRFDKSRGELKDRRTRDGESLEMTQAGESRARLIYSSWLEAHGTRAFGVPLDHGDVEDAQGDAELAEGPPADVPAASAVPVATVTSEDIAALRTAAEGLKGGQVKLALSSIGIDPPEPFTAEHAFDAVPIEKAALLAQTLAGVPR